MRKTLVSLTLVAGLTIGTAGIASAAKHPKATCQASTSQVTKSCNPLRSI